MVWPPQGASPNIPEASQGYLECRIHVAEHHGGGVAHPTKGRGRAPAARSGFGSLLAPAPNLRSAVGRGVFRGRWCYARRLKENESARQPSLENPESLNVIFLNHTGLEEVDLASTLDENFFCTLGERRSGEDKDIVTLSSANTEAAASETLQSLKKIVRLVPARRRANALVRSSLGPP